MKKITLLLSGIILAAAFCLAGCTTDAMGSAGANGKDGKDGQNGISIVWQGSHDYPPDNPQLNWAYYNTQEGTSYIYDGNSWQILAERGKGIYGWVSILKNQNGRN
ncbi:MAG: hypothetical protein IKP67_03920 [Spirochaetales bacterium]|nr:hypothetical protein [Spirochaetales bacterium]